MNWRPMKTAPLDRDVWVLGLAKPSEGYICQFQGQCGWDPNLKIWHALTFDEQGHPLIVIPLSWRPLPKWRSLSRKQSVQLEKQLMATIKRVHKEDV